MNESKRDRVRVRRAGWGRAALCGAFLAILLGCGWPWAKQEEPVPEGRFVESAIDYYEMGRNLEIHGNYPSAIEKYRQSIEISPRPAVYFALGSLQAELLEFEEGKENLRKALELSPGFGAARRELDRVEAVEKLMLREEPVPEEFRKKPMPPALRKGLEELGEEPVPGESASPSEEEGEGVELAPGPTAPSEATPETAIEPPEEEKEPREKGEAEETGKPAAGEAITEGPSTPDLTAQEVPPPAETLSVKDEAEVRALLREGRVLLDEGKVEKAIRLYQDALLEFPRVGSVYSSLGYAYQLAGNSRAAFLAYEDALRFGYSSAALYNNLGVTYEALNQKRLAEKAYRKAIDMGGFPDAHYNLAVLLNERGDLDEALQEYETYLALQPEGEHASEARSRADTLRRRIR